MDKSSKVRMSLYEINYQLDLTTTNLVSISISKKQEKLSDETKESISSLTEQQQLQNEINDLIARLENIAVSLSKIITKMFLINNQVKGEFPLQSRLFDVSKIISDFDADIKLFFENFLAYLYLQRITLRIENS